MTKRLQLTAATGAQEWELPADTDAAAVRENLLSAMTQGTTVEVMVDVHGDTGQAHAATPLLVNGRLLVTAAVVEAPVTSR
jgi:hypothetical protein